MDADAVNKQVATPRLAGAGGGAETFQAACHACMPASESATHARQRVSFGVDLHEPSVLRREGKKRWDCERPTKGFGGDHAYHCYHVVRNMALATMRRFEPDDQLSCILGAQSEYVFALLGNLM